VTIRFAYTSRVETRFVYHIADDAMFAGVESDKLFGGGSGENVYKSLLSQEYAKVAAKSGGTGIADAVQREILRMQEAQKK